ncbi:methyltransferase dimerization domain-containing protein [Parafrankia sp. EUN1f]|uniref:methyltransferase family protein n=1 Tax=Parafrankia sp. EUN1f TaxID=102897 RepID=UPI0001C4437D|nr:methyltransferase dimerization domain-containing protein [Parafrankia sp. EUN1f]EFC82962.1 O-methyltransferase family 2 [Parafrankia sp. EUN1f]
MTVDLSDPSDLRDPSSSTELASEPVVPGPAPIWEVIHGFTRYWAVVAALGLGLFEQLAAGPRPASALAAAVGVDEHRTALLADTLVALGLLTHEPAVGYRLGAVATTYLLAGAPRTMVALVRGAPGPHERWPELAETLRRGAPAVRIEDDPGGFYPALAAATAPVQRQVARAVAATLHPVGPEPLVIDLGAGAAPWALAFLAAWPRARALAVELPEVVAVTRRAIDAEIGGAAVDAAVGGATVGAESGAVRAGGRVRVVAGDYHEVELPNAAADVVVLGHVLRAESVAGARRLVARAAAALRPGGTLVVTDYPRPEVPTAPSAPALLMGLTMLASTGGDGIFRVADLHGWMRAAGLEPAATLQPLPGQTVMTARRP